MGFDMSAFLRAESNERFLNNVTSPLGITREMERAYATNCRSYRNTVTRESILPGVHFSPMEPQMLHGGHPSGLPRDLIAL